MATTCLSDSIRISIFTRPWSVTLGRECWNVPSGSERKRIYNHDFVSNQKSQDFLFIWSTWVLQMSSFDVFYVLLDQMNHMLFLITGSIGCVHILWQNLPKILMMASILPEAISYLGQLCFCQRYLWYFWHQRLKAKQMKICGITFWQKQVALSKIRLQELQI